MNTRFPTRWMGAIALLLAASTSASGQPRELPLSGAAWRLAEQAHQAYDRGDYALAVTQAREALRLRPDVGRLRQLLDNALAAQQLAQSPAARGMPPDPAFGAAARAYKAYDARDFGTAAAQARSAVALAPRNPAYRLLLVDALAAGGNVTEAAAALDAALAAVDDPVGALAARRQALRLRLAAQPLAQMYASLERGELARAVVAARAAVAAAPDVTAYRLMLVQVLARAGRLDEANQAAAAALALDGANAALLAMRGYLLQRAGDSTAAHAAFARALQAPEADAAAPRTLALIGADAALAAAQPQRALDLLAPFAADDGAALQARLGAARADLARMAAGDAPRSPAAPVVPELECRTAPYGQACTVIPGPPGPEPGFAAASEGHAAIAERQYELAVVRAREALAAAPGRRAYRQLLLAALQGGRHYLEAETVATALLAEDSADAGLLMQRALLRKQLGRHDDARQDFAAAAQLNTLGPGDQVAVLLELGRRPEAASLLAEALAQGRLAGTPALDIAYLAARTGNDALALAHFASADAAPGLPPGALLDAAYAALRAGANDRASGYFRRGTDAVRAGQLKLDDAGQFAVRRAVAELSRSWGVFAGASYRGAGALRGIAADTADDSVQAGIEAYWRPFGAPHGRTLELFARAYQTVHSAAGAGSDTLQPAAGIRVKPFGGSNLLFSVARLAGGGAAASTDWLAQASYFHGRGTDLHPGAASWWSTQVTAELGHYFGRRHDYGTVNASFGRSYRPFANYPNLVLTPHVALAHDYNSAHASRNAAGAGPGLTLRSWFREDTHTAPRSYLDLTLQYRARVAGDTRGKGLFFTATLSY